MFNHPLSILSTAGNFAPKLYSFYHLTPGEKMGSVKEGLSSCATPQNIAMATMAATAVSAALIHPTSRIALCAMLSISYSMTLLSLQLLIMGLYLGFAGMQGLGTASSLALSTAKGLASLGGLSGEAAKDLAQVMNKKGDAPALSKNLADQLPVVDKELNLWVEDFAKSEKTAPSMEWSQIIEESELFNPKRTDDWVAEFKPALARFNPDVETWVHEFRAAPGLNRRAEGAQWADELSKQEIKAPRMHPVKAALAIYTGFKLVQQGVKLFDQWTEKVVNESEEMTKNLPINYANISSDELPESPGFELNFTPMI